MKGLDRRIKQRQARRTECEGRWRRVITSLGFPQEAEPAWVLRAIDQLEKAAQAGREREGRRHRIEAIERDRGAFDGRVAALVARLAPDIASRPPSEHVGLLQQRLDAATAVAREREALGKAIEETGCRERGAMRRRDQAKAEIRKLLDAAGATEAAEVPAIQRRVEEARQLANEARGHERELRALGLGPVEALALEVAGIADPASLGPEAARLRAEADATARAAREQAEQTFNLDAELRRMGSAGGAEEATGLALERLAKARELGTEWAVLRGAEILLRMAADRYRKEHEGPVLRRASGLFARLTGGSFSGLATDFDERDRPVLAGQRAGGGNVRVEGMSDGTRDQLHLALRLAALDERLGRGEPLPMVLDDVLVHFDDRRAEAALSVLAEFSDRTQILLFTHHERTVDLATSAGGARVFVQRLASVA